MDDKPQTQPRKSILEIINLDDRQQQLEWFRTANKFEIQELIHKIAVHTGSQLYQLARTALEVRIAEDLLEAANITERQTNRLINLTWALIFLTLALVGLTVALLVVK